MVFRVAVAVAVISAAIAFGVWSLVAQDAPGIDLQALVGRARGTVVLPPGEHILTRPLVIRLAETGPIHVVGSGSTRLVMKGPGPAIQVIGTHGGTAAPSTMKDEVWNRQRTPLLDGIEIQGAHPEADGIELSGTMQATLTRITVRRARHAIHLIERNRNTQISDCHLYENRGAGVYLDRVNLHQINIVGSHISYNAGGGVVCRESEVRNLQIGTCDIEGNMPIGGVPSANILLDVAQGSVREGAIVGCTIQHDHDNIGSANVRFVGQPDRPMMVGNFSIANNVFSDTSIGIDLAHARGVSIVGNTFMESFEASVKGVNCSNLVLSGNLVDRNPDYKDEVSRNTFVFENCRDLLVDGCHFAQVHGEQGAIVFKNCDTCQVTDCMLVDCEATRIDVENCHRVRVSSCTFRPRKDEPKSEPVTITGGGDHRIEP